MSHLASSKCIIHRIFQALNYKPLVLVVNRQGRGGSFVYLCCINTFVADYGFASRIILYRDKVTIQGRLGMKIQRIDYEIEVAA